jgi:hypothetical protein
MRADSPSSSIKVASDLRKLCVVTSAASSPPRTFHHCLLSCWGRAVFRPSTERSSSARPQISVRFRAQQREKPRHAFQDRNLGVQSTDAFVGRAKLGLFGVVESGQLPGVDQLLAASAVGRLIADNQDRQQSGRLGDQRPPNQALYGGTPRGNASARARLLRRMSCPKAKPNRLRITRGTSTPRDIPGRLRWPIGHLSETNCSWPGLGCDT